MACQRDRHAVLLEKDGVLQFVEVPRPTRRPEDCGMSNEDFECLGCGVKLGCLNDGKCYAVDGETARAKD